MNDAHIRIADEVININNITISCPWVEIGSTARFSVNVVQTAAKCDNLSATAM
jgi:hypothetical protein